MMRKAILIAAVLALSACTMTESVAVSAAKDMMKKQFKDPNSVEFQNVQLHDQGSNPAKHWGTLCGEVNAKNGFGGYSGFQRFSAHLEYTDGGHIEVSQFVIGGNSRGCR